MAADALQGRKHLGNEVAALLQRGAQRLLAVVERRETRLRLRDPLFHGGDARGGVDDLLVELAAIVADELDLALELCLFLQRLALLGAQRLELLVALLEAVEADRRPGWRSAVGRGARLRRRRRWREGATRQGRAAISRPRSRRADQGSEIERAQTGCISAFVSKNAVHAAIGTRLVRD